MIGLVCFEHTVFEGFDPHVCGVLDLGVWNDDGHGAGLSGCAN